MTARDATTRWTLADRPVTVAEYREFVEATGREWPGPSPDWQDDWPANLTTWHDATDYCEWRTAQGYPCRLPTEAEWVAGTPSGWTVGDENERNGRAVWEWTADPWDPGRPDGPRVLRGGSWLGLQISARAAYRDYDLPSARHGSLGFRVVVARAAPGPLASGDTAAIRAALAAMRARADAVLDPYVPVSTTTALDDLPLLLAVAEAVAGLRATMDSGDGLPWWCRYEGGVGFWCVGCGCAAGSSAVVHATDCYALALDRALAAIAAGGG